MSSREGERRGGYRKPANPAPVSGPGALSRRTDGGPGDNQPIRLPSGGHYGERQALEQQQQGAPLAAGTEAPAVPVGGGGPPTTIEGHAAPGADVFRPTEIPQRPIGYAERAGVMGQGRNEPGSQAVLAEMVKRFPSPYLLRLLQNHNG